MPRRPKLDEEAIERTIAELADTLAGNAGALADVVSRWREPEVARRLLESMFSGDRERFDELTRPNLPDPPMNLCIFMVELVEKMAWPAIVPTVCRMRTDLSPDEHARYLALVLEFWRRDELPPIEKPGALSLVGPVIPPGPFLDALRVEGLVTCREEPIEPGTSLVVTPPQRWCA